MVTDLCRVLAKIDTPRLHSVRWHLTTDRNIATPIVALTSTIISRRLLQICKVCEVWSSNPWDLVAHLQGWVGEHITKIRCALIIKRHSLGDSSIAILQVSKKCTVTLRRAGYTLGFATLSASVIVCNVVQLLNLCFALCGSFVYAF